MSWQRSFPSRAAFVREDSSLTPLPEDVDTIYDTIQVHIPPPSISEIVSRPPSRRQKKATKPFEINHEPTRRKVPPPTERVSSAEKDLGLWKKFENHSTSNQGGKVKSQKQRRKAEKVRLSSTPSKGEESLPEGQKKPVSSRKRKSGGSGASVLLETEIVSTASVKRPRRIKQASGPSGERHSRVLSGPPSPTFDITPLPGENDITISQPISTDTGRFRSPSSELSPCPSSETSGHIERISASKFGKVLRILMGLPQEKPVRREAKRDPPTGRPLVWAESRQELCEALPYYRAFQSGLYMSSGLAFGYLLDAFPSPRDVWAADGRVIISHGGGQSIRPKLANGKLGKPILSADQDFRDARVASLVNACEKGLPLILITGSGYSNLPWRQQCAYAVLGWYWVSLVWSEAESVARDNVTLVGKEWVKRVKIRFDWVECQGQPWWQSSSAEIRPIPDGEIAKRPSREHPLTPPWRDFEELSLCSKQLFVEPNRNHLPTPPTTPPGQCKEIRPPTSFEKSEVHYDITSDTIEQKFDHEGQKLTKPDGADYRPKRSPHVPGTFRLASFDLHRSVSCAQSSNAFPQIARTCRCCGRRYPKIYAEGWICLNTFCQAYWMVDTRIGILPIPPGFALHYSSSFLNPPEPPPGLKPPHPVVPPVPVSNMPDQAESEASDGPGSRVLWKGWVCGDCGRANCRFRWEVWECLHCHQLLAPLEPSAIVPPTRSQCIFGDSLFDPRGGIITELRRFSDPSVSVMVYRLPEGGGTIYHVMHDDASFADRIFQEYQKAASSTPVPLFQRRPLRNSTVKGQLLAQHFAVNSGASYKYNVDSLSLSLEESPECIKDALQVITDRAFQVTGEEVKFNEVLSVMYREGQKMNWHDDGEPGLGPIVGGLSLGSTATMSFRPKSTRLGHNISHRSVKCKQVHAPICLSVTLSHGDILMMQGRVMQDRYSHRVVPNGFRVAATARVIQSELLDLKAVRDLVGFKRSLVEDVT